MQVPMVDGRVVGSDENGWGLCTPVLDVLSFCHQLWSTFMGGFTDRLLDFRLVVASLK